MCLGIPGRIVDIIDPEHGVARVDMDGQVRDVSIALLTEDDEVSVGDWVLVHMGFAMAKTDAEEAATTQRMLEDLVRAYDDDLRGDDTGQQSLAVTEAATREG